MKSVLLKDDVLFPLHSKSYGRLKKYTLFDSCTFKVHGPTTPRPALQHLTADARGIVAYAHTADKAFITRFAAPFGACYS
jgi:hypothetical protein